MMNNGEETCRSSGLKSGEESDRSENSRHIRGNSGWPGGDEATGENIVILE